MRHWRRLPRKVVGWCPIPGSIQGQAGWGFEQPDFEEGVPDTARTADPNGSNRCSRPSSTPCSPPPHYQKHLSACSRGACWGRAGEDLAAGSGRAVWVPSPAQGSNTSRHSDPAGEVALSVSAGQASLGSTGAQGCRRWALPASASWGITQSHFCWKLPVAGRTEMSLSVGKVCRAWGFWQPPQPDPNPVGPKK